MGVAFLYGQRGGAPVSDDYGSQFALTPIFSDTQTAQTITPTHEWERYLLVNGSQVSADEDVPGSSCKIGSKTLAAYDSFGTWSCTAVVRVVQNGSTYDLTKLDGTVVESGLTSFKVQNSLYQYISAAWLDII